MKVNNTQSNPASTWENLPPLYRGSPQTNQENIIKIKSPKNRIPKNTPLEIQEEMDDWFEREFGIRFRTNSIFATGNLLIAGSYTGSAGEIRVLTPVTDYAFCWSPDCCDLYGELTREDRPKEETLLQMLERLNFQCSDIAGAIKSGNEIMIVCDCVDAKKYNLLTAPPAPPPR